MDTKMRYAPIVPPIGDIHWVFIEKVVIDFNNKTPLQVSYKTLDVHGSTVTSGVYHGGMSINREVATQILTVVTNLASEISRAVLGIKTKDAVEETDARKIEQL